MTSHLTSPRIGLALGGGGARGLAHIPLLEAFDELGLKPAVIAGSSIGAIIGACYASGLSGKDLRLHCERLLSNRMDMAKYIFGARKMKPSDLLSLRGITSVHLQSTKLVEIALPESVPATFEELPIPLKVITTDFDNMKERVFAEGLLRQAVAASIAIPGVLAGPMIDGRPHVDGGVTNPVPFNHVNAGTDFVVAIEVSGRPKPSNGEMLSNIEMAIGSLLIMFHQVAELRRVLKPPEIYIEPQVNLVRTGDFFRAREIFEMAAPAKEALKRQLEKTLNKLALGHEQEAPRS